MTFQSGFPGPITFGVDRARIDPDLVAGQNGNLPVDQRTWKRWFNLGVFTQNAIRLTGIAGVDSSVNKKFRIKEARSLEFRTEFFNLFNNFNPTPRPWI